MYFMRKIFRSLLFFLFVAFSFNIVFAQNPISEATIAEEYKARCDGRCRGSQEPTHKCQSISDENTCNNRYIIERGRGVGMHSGVEPYTCAWNQSRHRAAPQFWPACAALEDPENTSNACKCNKTYSNPSKGIPDIRQRCNSGRVNYQGLCYTPCDGSYEMRSAGICTLRGL
jgi:hypothetical protein